MIRLILLFFTLLIGLRLSAQVTVGAPVAPEPFSILQVEGNNGGVRLPRLTQVEREDLTTSITGNSKANGLVIYNITTGQLNYWNGTAWTTLPLTLVQNGLQLTGPLKIRLGGALTKDTHIDLLSHSLKFNATTGRFVVNSNSLVINENGKIGIGTENPQGVFHIDAGKDNSLSPTNSQLANDIIVDTDGKLGVGMLPLSADDSRLQVNGPITIRAGETPVADVDYILMTKDGTGQAKWVRNAALMPPIVMGEAGGTGGETDGLTEAVDESNAGKYIGCRVTLPPGRWAVQTVLLLSVSGDLTDGKRIETLFTWSEQRNTTVSSSDIQSGIYMQGNIIRGSYSVANGITVIKNSTASEKTYYLNIREVMHNNPGVSWDKLGSSRWDETSITAHPFLFAE